MNIEIIMTPGEAKGSFSGKIVIVIDVLRASTTILNALENGAYSVKAVKSVEEALHYKMSDLNILIGGERGGLKQPGFDLGNSPPEYNSETVKNKQIILTTTNGAQAILKSENADQVLIGCFRNLSAAAEQALTAGKDIVFFCAGTEERFSFEDTICAGLMINELVNENSRINRSDSAVFTEHALKSIGFNHRPFKEQILQLLRTTEHGRRLINLGFERDLDFCSEINCSKKVPVLTSGKFMI